MAHLPNFRFAESEKQYPFLNVGLDFFGPFYIEHRNRKLEKQYVCLLTCLVARAVHLAVCQTLDTDSCLLAIRRFASRRGYPELIISDNGSDFTSTKKMLDLSKISIHNDYIKSQLQQQNIIWKMNPPLAPYFGGIWERLIQSDKRTLLMFLGSQQLKAQVFHTIVAETEGLLNSRPITYVSSDTNDEEALTTNHFLLRRPYSRLAPLTSTSRTFKKRSSLTHKHYWIFLETFAKGVHIRCYQPTKVENRIIAIERRQFSLVIAWVQTKRSLANGSNCEMSQWIGRTSTIFRKQDINWSAEQTSSQIS